ncbi:Protein kinase-like domain [Pseudocohnilembus persalinus]|uniref:Protein kinase-like domain n=1 Tax=Pseudocohnilembus persalinus TaxID=266149 RepID=A0A0V0QMF6_PSEPJ|nr:Protein kinase-like domain [Pseudocohnilembus persalinus]|eukprot:KRX03240.1 Protein kinase-like domain [Pseudocohnilembus persalinus]
MDQIQKDKKNQKAKKFGQVNEINGYQIVEELGSGSYSTVFKVRKGDQIWALKLLDKEQIKRENLYECVQTEEIHKNSYLHRDLKPENIFIHNGVFKIADFGLAKSSSVGRTQCGSRYYIYKKQQ